MPYLRSSRGRSRSRSMSSVARRGMKYVWTYDTIATSFNNTPTLTDLSSTLLVQEGILDRVGITYMGSRLCLSGAALTAIAAGTRDQAVMGIVRAAQNSTAAQLDPSAIATRSLHKWAYLTNWQYPYLAAPPAANFTIEGTRIAQVKAKRAMRDNQDAIFAAFGNQNAAVTWHVDGIISSLWLVR